MALSIIRERAAEIQIPLSSIQSLAAATLHAIDQMGPVEKEHDRQLIQHICNFADLIQQQAGQLSKEAENIERMAGTEHRSVV